MGVLREGQEKLERRMEKERRELPLHHQAILDKEESRLKGAMAALEEEKAVLETERARMWDEMEAWRVRMESEEKAVRIRVRSMRDRIG